MDLEKLITTLKNNAAVKEALTLLRSQLPTTLLYHAYEHTEDVLREAVQLASSDGLSNRDIELVAVAAAWHDVGFIWQSNNNEPIAADAVRRYLSGTTHYTPKEIDLIAQMILDTALISAGDSYKQVATRPLSCYLLDADLANFGRDDFFDKSELQRRELGEEVDSFRQKTLMLVRSHTWHTPAARAKWQAKKDANIAALERLVASGQKPL
jgi:uncharacterized protein